MTPDLDAVLRDHPATPETARTVTTPKPRCKRHDWTTWAATANGLDRVVAAYCYRCGVFRDEAKARRGKSAARFGKDQERRIERTYGPRKVGEFGDAIDLMGAVWKWQSKASRLAPPLWLVSVDAPTHHRPSQTVLGASQAMLPLAPHLLPLVITSFVDRKHGTRDWIWVRCSDWMGLPCLFDDWLVMSGAWFLDHHGPDREETTR